MINLGNLFRLIGSYRRMLWLV